MINKSFNIRVHRHHHGLRKLFVDNSDAERVFRAIDDVVGEYQAAQESGGKFEARGVAVLGKSGAGKTLSVEHALSNLGLNETEIGDGSRPILIIELGAKATLKGVYSDICSEYGWDAGPRDTAQQIWTGIRGYIRDLKTFVIVLDEIQHVRSASATDRADLQNFLKSLVQPRQSVIVPILIGMPSFQDVLVSDRQLFRRYRQVHMRNLDPAIDLSVAIRTLNEIVDEAGLKMAPCVTSREFAARLLHTCGYTFGEMCAYCRAGLKQAMFDNSAEVRIEHFEEAYRFNTDCLPAVNPFVAVDFQNIQISD